MNFKSIFKKILPHILVILGFVVISFIYFSPVIEGKILRQNDVEQAKGAQQEILKFTNEDSDPILWTNSIFCGMPTYVVWLQHSGNVFKKIGKVVRLGLPQYTIDLLFLYMLGFYILLISTGFNIWLSALGALAFAFSSYNIIIIKAGHVNKSYVIAFAPIIIAGALNLFKNKYFLGAILLSLGLGLNIAFFHPQITYYIAISLLVLYIIKFYYYYKEKKIKQYITIVAISLGAVILGVLPNTSELWTMFEYQKYSNRGKSELTSNKESQKTRGIDMDYALQWSYGKAESFSLIIPNIKGGESGFLGNDPQKIEKARPEFKQYLAQQNSYWGDQPFTSGPVYFGAIICFLFLFAAFVVKGPLKKWLLFVTILSIILSWGRHFMPTTELFFNFFPFFNKFRVPSMILVLTNITLLMLALMGLREIIKNPKIIIEKSKQFYISIGCTAGLALLFYLVPTLFFDFLSDKEAEFFTPMIQKGGNQATQYGMLLDDLKNIRIEIFKSDALRSFMFVIIAVIAIYAYVKNKLKLSYFIIGLTTLIVIDLWMVDKRYLNNDNFNTKREVKSVFKETEVDRYILQDKDPHYRVFNLTNNPFNDSHTSYYHKSIGGYHATKIRRYQDVIERYLSKQNKEVINMLNTKYFIAVDKEKRKFPVKNDEAYGNCWFVNSINIVNNADEEIEALQNINKSTAIVNKEYAKLIDGVNKDSITGTITLTKYHPNKITYNSVSNKKRLAVFSEVYYPRGWVAYIDGKEVDLFRANYILRALVIPKGEHEIVLEFKPKAYNMGNKISMIGSILFLLLVIGYLITLYRRKKK